MDTKKSLEETRVKHVMKKDDEPEVHFRMGVMKKYIAK